MKRRISLSPLPASPVNSGEPFMMIAMRAPPWSGALARASMCSRNRVWPSLMRGSPGPNRPVAPRSCSSVTVSLSRFQSFP